MNPKIFTHSEPDEYGQILGTGYLRFESKFGVGGLAKERGDRLDILAVHSLVEGKGMFRDFISACKSEYRIICVWWIANRDLEKILARYAFEPEMEIQGDGEAVSGYRWDKKTRPDFSKAG